MIETNIPFSKKPAALFFEKLVYRWYWSVSIIKKEAADEWNLGVNETIIIKF